MATTTNAPMIGGDKALLGADLMTNAGELFEACVELSRKLPMVPYDSLTDEQKRVYSRFERALFACGYRIATYEVGDFVDVMLTDVYGKHHTQIARVTSVNVSEDEYELMVGGHILTHIPAEHCMPYKCPTCGRHVNQDHVFSPIYGRRPYCSEECSSRRYSTDLAY